MGLDHSGSSGRRGWKRPSSIVCQWLGALWVFTVFKPWVEVGREGARVRGHSNGEWGVVYQRGLGAGGFVDFQPCKSCLRSPPKLADKLTGRSVLGKMLA